MCMISASLASMRRASSCKLFRMCPMTTPPLLTQLRCTPGQFVLLPPTLLDAAAAAKSSHAVKGLGGIIGTAFIALIVCKPHPLLHVREGAGTRGVGQPQGNFLALVSLARVPTDTFTTCCYVMCTSCDHRAGRQPKGRSRSERQRSAAARHCTRRAWSALPGI